MMFRTHVRTALAVLLALMISVPTLSALAQDDRETADDSELAEQLPPVDLPTMNAMNYRFSLDSIWNGTANTPEELPIYRFDPIVYTEEDVQSLAEELGVEGEVTSQGEDSYSISGEGSIFTTPGLLQYFSPSDASEGDLPDDEQAIGFARDWLRTHNLLPPNVGDGEVLTRVEAPARIIVGFKPTAPAPLLSSTPGIIVNVGPGGTIIEARVNWAEISEGDMYRLRQVEDAFSAVASRQSYLNVTLPADDFPQGSSITGEAAYDNVSIAYSSSGVPGGTQYLQPVYVFEGSVVPEGADSPYPIIAYVAAIVTGLEPVG